MVRSGGVPWLGRAESAAPRAAQSYSSIAASISVEAATRAALMKIPSGMASNVVPFTSTVRHSDPPQTEQQRLLPTFGAKPFLHRPARDPNAVRFRWIRSERLLVDRRYFECGFDPNGVKRFSESSDRVLHLPVCGVAALAGLPAVTHESLPSYRQCLQGLSSSRRSASLPFARVVAQGVRGDSALTAACSTPATARTGATPTCPSSSR